MSEKTEKLKELDKEINTFLESSGMKPDEISELTKKIKTREEKKRTLDLFSGSDANEIGKKIASLLDREKMEARIIEAIKEIKIEPKITVEAPQVYVEQKEPKVTVNPPAIPEIKVSPPKVILQERPFPSEIVVKGFSSFVKGIITILRGQLDVKLGNVSKKTPLPVILTHESKFYKAMLVAAGGSSGRLWIKNAKNQVVSPLSQQHTTVATGTAFVTTAGTAKQLPNVECKKAWIQVSRWNADAANCPNGGWVIVGGTAVTATPFALVEGKIVYPTQGDWFNVDNLNRLYIDSLDSGAKIHYYVER